MITIIRRGPVAVALAAMFFSGRSLAADWPQWGGTGGRNQVAAETGLPDAFLPGEKDPQGGEIDLATTRNVKWVARLSPVSCASPTVAAGRVFIGTCHGYQGALTCLDESTGSLLWRYSAPSRAAPDTIDGKTFSFSYLPQTLGICSSPAVDGDRLYVVNHRCEVLCLDVHGGDEAGEGPPHGPQRGALLPQTHSAKGRAAKVIWSFDMWELGVRPACICNCSVLVHGDLLYVGTSNGVDRDGKLHPRDELRKAPAPLAPSLIALDKRTGRLVAADDEQIGTRVLHGQWSSPSLGRIGPTTLVFFGGGDGVCYAFAAAPAGSARPGKLKKVWSFDCNPPEYKSFGKWDKFSHYALGDQRCPGTLNQGDGTFLGMSEIVATPVFHANRVYVAIGRDPEHGRGRGALHCIDAAQTGEISVSGSIWCYKDLDRTLSTVSLADGLLFIADVAGRVHCLDADTGRCYWVHETKAEVWGSTLVADGKVYLPTAKHLWILAAAKEKKILNKISLGSPLWATPVAANGVLYIASTRYLWAVQRSMDLRDLRRAAER